jgi:hypothetical protein
MLVRRIGLLLVLAMLALCGVFTGTASAAVPGLELVHASTVPSSDLQQGVIVFCPPGKRLIGASAIRNGGGGQGVITSIVPDGNLSQVRVEANAGTPIRIGEWSVTGYAICANPLPGLQVVSATSAVNSAGVKSVGAVCPAGKQVIGAGGSANGDPGEVSIGFLAPQEPELTDVGVMATKIIGAPVNWNVSAFAICANPLPGLQLVFASSPNNRTVDKNVAASCPTGKRVTGMGFQIPGGRGQVSMNSLFPNDALTAVVIVGIARAEDVGFDWGVTAFAVCATA